jgi:hexosaminidase
MPSTTPNLFPVPRQVEWLSGQVELPHDLVLVLASWPQELYPAAQRFQQQVQARLGITVSITASAVGLAQVVHVEVAASDSVTHPQGYQLTVSPERVCVEASSPTGAAYGLATLAQLCRGRHIPCVAIADYPDFERRGVMLDISRGKVPTMETLYRFVDMLADLKLNEFQLYTEHTFAYRNHRLVWQDWSPMTGEQILALDRYCRERFIDLVPNQNSFGHMHDWLIHEPYHHLAEQLEGWNAWGTRIEGPFSLCPIELAVVPFLAELYDELLPHFSSQYFNVGCDETLDVGQGRSKEAVEQLGEHRVYLSLLLKIYEQVKARGKTMQFWGDIIIKAPEFIAELPKDIVALEWGYEADHPFDSHCEAFAKAGVPFYVCPGTSTWNSLAGRTKNAYANILSAAENGLKHGALGFLNTIWGDRGHQDYQPICYLPVAFGAGVSWSLATNREADVPGYLSESVFADRSGKIGQVLYDLGNVYQATGVTPYNSSTLGLMMHHPVRSVTGLKDVTPEGLDHAAAEIRRLAARFGELELGCADGALVLRELNNCVRMLLHACELGKLKLTLWDGGAPDLDQVKRLAVDLDEIMAEHRLLWLERNRIGGLEERSLKPLRQIRSGYAELLKG